VILVESLQEEAAGYKLRGPCKRLSALSDAKAVVVSGDCTLAVPQDNRTEALVNGYSNSCERRDFASAAATDDIALRI
jgi:hypothetical protein